MAGLKTKQVKKQTFWALQRAECTRDRLWWRDGRSLSSFWAPTEIVGM